MCSWVAARPDPDRLRSSASPDAARSGALGMSPEPMVAVHDSLCATLRFSLKPQRTEKQKPQYRSRTVDSRTISSTEGSSVDTGRPSIRFSIAFAATSPSSYTGWRTVVSGGIV